MQIPVYFAKPGVVKQTPAGAVPDWNSIMLNFGHVPRAREYLLLNPDNDDDEDRQIMVRVDSVVWVASDGEYQPQIFAFEVEEGTLAFERGRPAP